MILYQKGKRQKEIAEMFGRSLNSIEKKINKLKRISHENI
jgi:transposase